MFANKMSYEDMHALEMFLRDISEMAHGKDGEHWRHSVTDAQHDEALRLLKMYTVVFPFGS